MNSTAILTSAFINLITLLVSLNIVMASSHLPCRLSRAFATILAAVSLAALGYWMIRYFDVRSLTAVDQTVRFIHGLATGAALWEVSHMLRVWARSPKAEGLDIIEVLSHGGEEALAAKLAVDNLDAAAWARRVDKNGRLGEIIALNALAKERFNETGPPTGDAKKQADDVSVFGRLVSGAIIFKAPPIQYQMTTSAGQFN